MRKAESEAWGRDGKIDFVKGTEEKSDQAKTEGFV